MIIISALMKENVRLTCGKRWLAFDEINEEWVVYTRKPYARESTLLIATKIQDEAIKVLLKN